MNRAYSILNIKAFDEDARTITGIATTPKTDRMGDIVESEGAEYELPIPLLWQHRSSDPIGYVTNAKVTKNGIEITAKIESIDEPGDLKNLLDKAWQSIKKGLVRGLSIGFRPIESSDIEGSWFAQRFIKWEWLELSAVTIPANAEATIQTVKQFDEGAPAAAGTAPVVKSPGASGTVVKLNSTPKAKGKMKTAAEQIQQFEAERAAKDARRAEIMSKAAGEGRTLDQAEEEEYDNLASDLESIDKHLVRLREMEKSNKSVAAPVSGQTTEQASQSRGTTQVVSVTPRAEKGVGFARHVMALAVSKGNTFEAAEYARRTWGDGVDEVYNGLRNGMVTRAAVAPGSTTNATFAAPLVATNYLNEFLDLLRPATLLGKIPGLRHVPFNVSMPAQTAGGTYKWVGQGKWKPVTNAQYAAVTLGFAKASGIIVLTEELVRLSTPSAETAVRDELVKGMQAFLDLQFVDATVAAVANVNPASITNGVTGTAASGTTPTAARTDIAARIAAFAALGYPVNELVMLMSESQAFNLGLALNAVGSPLFPGLTATGGSIIGVPVVTSQAVGAQIIIAHAPSILMADENGVEIDISREASLQLDSAPTDPADATAVLTSLWQANLVGLRVERWITWGKARSTAVDRITANAYVP